MSYQTKVRANYLNRTAKLAFFKARQRQGDVNRISEETGYSPRMVYYTISGERKVNTTIANAMYMVTRRRQKNSDYANA
jgi:hypothetical protein